MLDDPDAAIWTMLEDAPLAFVISSQNQLTKLAWQEEAFADNLSKKIKETKEREPELSGSFEKLLLASEHRLLKLRTAERQLETIRRDKIKIVPHHRFLGD